jgi:hypothetical protein
MELGTDKAGKHASIASKNDDELKKKEEEFP